MEKKPDSHDKPPEKPEAEIADNMPDVRAGRGVWRAANVALAAILLYSLDRGSSNDSEAP